MILYEGPSLLEPKTPIVVVATEDENPKTGRMLFTWILRQDRPPEVAAYDGSDSAICGDCKFRAQHPIPQGQAGDQRKALQSRLCYVRLSPTEGADEATPPSEVWRKWKAGEFSPCHPDFKLSEHQPRFPWELVESGGIEVQRYLGPLPVRIGSYGDPAAVPTRVWAELVRYAKNWTGYTHLWKPKPCPCKHGQDCVHAWNPDPDLKRYCMASVDTPEERAEAQARGWRTFFVVPEDEAEVWAERSEYLQRIGYEPADILCPATDPHPRRGKVCSSCEGKGYQGIKRVGWYLGSCKKCNGTGRVSTTCAVCGLCRGTSARSPSIWEIAHGKNKSNHSWD